MRIALKIIIAISFLIIIGLIILPFVLIYLNISIDPYDKYISAVGSLIVILLMLVTIILTENSSKEHITSIENATMKQIESWQRWDVSRRRQSIKSLKHEFKLNMEVYICIQKQSSEGRNNPVANNFILTSLEKSLYNSPIEDDLLNKKLLDCYYLLKGDNNVLAATRTPNFSGSSLDLINSILSNFTTKKGIFDETIKMLDEYENE